MSRWLHASLCCACHIIGSYLLSILACTTSTSTPAPIRASYIVAWQHCMQAIDAGSERHATIMAALSHPFGSGDQEQRLRPYVTTVPPTSFFIPGTTLIGNCYLSLHYLASLLCRGVGSLSKQEGRQDGGSLCRIYAAHTKMHACLFFNPAPAVICACCIYAARMPVCQSVLLR
jgi:hypothetical protein